MRIGDYEIKWDGTCYMVGKPPRSKSKKAGMEKAKFYPRLDQALASLPDRMASEVFDTCGDLVEFRDRLRAVAEALLEPLENAVQEARSGGAGDSSGNHGESDDEPPAAA